MPCGADDASSGAASTLGNKFNPQTNLSIRIQAPSTHTNRSLTNKLPTEAPTTNYQPKPFQQLPTYQLKPTPHQRHTNPYLYFDLGQFDQNQELIRTYLSNQTQVLLPITNQLSFTWSKKVMEKSSVQAIIIRRPTRTLFIMFCCKKNIENIIN